MRLAVPSVGEGGLEAERSGHFGHCDCFTIVDIEGNEVTSVTVVDNPPHSEGGCLSAVGLLASHGVSALAAAGMGARPLAGFQDAGIVVYFESETPIVGDVVRIVAGGELPIMDARQACTGH
jgi:predicted Fe-Mo cluster-binding NifX family protein